MIKLKAILVESGRAFIQEGGKYYHIASPYTLDGRIELEKEEDEQEPDDIEEATTGYGYERRELEFENYTDLCNYLLAEYNRWKVENKKQDRTLSDAERLRLMPTAMFKVFVKNLQKKFDAGDLDPVMRMAGDMLENVHAGELKAEIEILHNLRKSIIEKRQNEMSSVFVNIADVVGCAELESLYGTSRSLRLSVKQKLVLEEAA